MLGVTLESLYVQQYLVGQALAVAHLCIYHRSNNRHSNSSNNNHSNSSNSNSNSSNEGVVRRTDNDDEMDEDEDEDVNAMIRVVISEPHVVRELLDALDRYILQY